MSLKTRISRLEVTTLPTKERWAASVGIANLDGMIAYLKSLQDGDEFNPPEQYQEYFSRLARILGHGDNYRCLI